MVATNNKETNKTQNAGSKKVRAPRFSRSISREPVINLYVNEKIHPETTDVEWTIGEITSGFEDSTNFESGGVTSMNGKLIVRPSYQREYVHEVGDTWSKELIQTVFGGGEIQTLHIGDCGCGFYDVIDGQQRITTLGMFVNGKFACTFTDKFGVKRKKVFSQLDKATQESFLSTKLDVKLCSGTIEQKNRLFYNLNSDHAKLTPQEIRNALYASVFVDNLKRNFTNPKGFANAEKSKYNPKNFRGKKIEIIRQEGMEFALYLYSYRYCAEHGLNDLLGHIDNQIDAYMNDVYLKEGESEKVINYYKDFCDWVFDIFMHDDVLESFQSLSRVDWARIYYEYRETTMTWDGDEKRRASRVLRKILSVYKEFTYAGSSFEWILRGCKIDEWRNFLSIRGFSKQNREEMYLRQGGIDPITGKHCKLEDMHMHHIYVWYEGGLTVIENGILLSKDTHIKLHNGLYPEYTPEKLIEARDRVISEQKKKNGISDNENIFNPRSLLD